MCLVSQAQVAACRESRYTTSKLMKSVRLRLMACLWLSVIFPTRRSSGGNSPWTPRAISSRHPGRPIRVLRVCLPLATSLTTCIARPSPLLGVAVWRLSTLSAGWRRRDKVGNEACYSCLMYRYAQSSRERLLSSYSDLKRGINHSSGIPNGGMQDAFLSERTLCIYVDGSSIGVQ